jgi:hypothetical protein
MKRFHTSSLIGLSPRPYLTSVFRRNFQGFTIPSFFLRTPRLMAPLP